MSRPPKAEVPQGATGFEARNRALYEQIESVVGPIVRYYEKLRVPADLIKGGILRFEAPEPKEGDKEVRRKSELAIEVTGRGFNQPGYNFNLRYAKLIIEGGLGTGENQKTREEAVQHAGLSPTSLSEELLAIHPILREGEETRLAVLDEVVEWFKRPDIQFRGLELKPVYPGPVRLGRVATEAQIES